MKTHTTFAKAIDNLDAWLLAAGVRVGATYGPRSKVAKDLAAALHAVRAARSELIVHCADENPAVAYSQLPYLAETEPGQFTVSVGGLRIKKTRVA